jgi:hypothetical protein
MSAEYNPPAAALPQRERMAGAQIYINSLRILYY